MGERFRRAGGVLTACGFVILGLGASPASASDVFLSNNTLVIFGDSQFEPPPNEVDLITISLAGETFTITDAAADGINTGSPCTQVDPNTVTCPQDPPDPAPPSDPSPPVDSIFATLSGGADSLTNLSPIGTGHDGGSPFGGGINGGSGNDTLTGGPAPEALFAGLGNDSLDGGGGDDDLFEESEDFFINRSARLLALGTDSYVGGAGDDVTHMEARTDPLTIALDGQGNDGAPGENDNVQTEGVIGGQGNDSIVGDASANELLGGIGDDTLLGRGGADELRGQRGADILGGGPAHDRDDCGSGVDVAFVRPNDQVDGNCERTGARLASDTARIRGGDAARVLVECPGQEGAACGGDATLRFHGQVLGGSGFQVSEGKVKGVIVDLNADGQRLVARNGAIRVSARLVTEEPGGVSIRRGRLLLVE